MSLPGTRKYPREWIVGEDLWRIKFVSKIQGCDDTLGLCDPSDLTIYIKLGIGKLETLKTFLHEIGHAQEYSYDFKVLNNKTFDYRAIHRYIHHFETVWAEVFIANLDRFLELFSAAKASRRLKVDNNRRRAKE